MDELTPRTKKRAAAGALSIVMAVMVLAGCGIGGDNGDETATAAVETSVSSAPNVANTPSVQVETESSPVLGATESEAGATPGAATPTPAIVVSAPPVVMPTAPPTEAATPTAPGAIATPVPAAGGVAVGDGTGGPGAIPAEAATPAGEAATPEVAAALTVTNCDAVDYPPYSGDSPTQITTADVNFREGPGSDCTAIGEPIGAGVAVEVLSDPVEREGDDFVWVAVSLDGQEGWLATEFLEPASE
jgi:hypothetical protein